MFYGILSTSEPSFGNYHLPKVALTVKLHDTIWHISKPNEVQVILAFSRSHLKVHIGTSFKHLEPLMKLEKYMIQRLLRVVLDAKYRNVDIDKSGAGGQRSSKRVT